MTNKYIIKKLMNVVANERRIYPIPVTIVPIIINLFTPYLSNNHPVIGPRIPFSALDKANGIAVCAEVKPKLCEIGIKKTVKPFQCTDPAIPLFKDEAATMYQP